MMIMTNPSRRGARISLFGFVGLACVLAVGCGDDEDKDTSFVDPDATAGSSNNGEAGADSGIQLGTAGDGTLLGLGGSDGAFPGAGGADCGSTKVAAEPPVVNVLLVVDKSLSMDDTPTGFAT